MVRAGRKFFGGFTYLGLLIAVVFIGMSLAGAGTMWSSVRKRDNEQELLRIGNKFREAIGNYYNRTPGVIKQYPPDLQTLLHDNRFPMPQRYLRQIYADPFTGMRNWGILEAPSGGVMGVYSLAGGKPQKVANFREADKMFENKDLYEEWIFVYLPMDEILERQSRK